MDYKNGKKIKINCVVCNAEIEFKIHWKTSYVIKNCKCGHAVKYRHDEKKQIN